MGPERKRNQSLESLKMSLEDILQTNNCFTNKAELYRALVERDLFKGVYTTFINYTDELPLEFKTNIDKKLEENKLTKAAALHLCVQELLDSKMYYTRREIYAVLKNKEMVDYTEHRFNFYFKTQQFTLPKGFHGSSSHKGHKKKSERLQELCDLVKSVGTNDAAILAEKMKLGRGSVLMLARDSGISLANTNVELYPVITRRDPVRDAVIAHDPPYLTYDALAKAAAEKTGQKKISRQRMVQYLRGTGQRESWQQRCDAYKKTLHEKKQQLNEEQKLLVDSKQQLVQLVSAYLWKRAVEEGPATEKAVLYHFKNRKKGSAIGLDRLLGLFNYYYQAKKQGKQLSLEELGEPHKLVATVVGKCLKKAGLEPLYGARDRHVTPLWKKQALERGIDIALPASSIAYLLDIPSHIVQQKIFCNGGKGVKVDSWIAKFGNYKESVEIIRYQHASQLYEALAVGFSRDEAIEYADVSNQGYDYLIEHRKRIEATLVNAIKTLYNQPMYDKPYVTTALKEEADNRSKKYRSF